jgi:Zn finger protein HypA/HybF involved in hydrogenase expression
VFQDIIGRQVDLFFSMSKKLLLQQHQPLQTEKELTIPDIEQEIECPRCNDIMALCSDFDSLCYLCQECNLSLLVN